MQHLGDRSVFVALRASFGWSRSFLRMGARAIHCQWCPPFIEGELLAIGDAGMAGCFIVIMLHRRRARRV